MICMADLPIKRYFAHLAAARLGPHVNSRLAGGNVPLELLNVFLSDAADPLAPEKRLYVPFDVAAVGCEGIYEGLSVYGRTESPQSAYARGHRL